MARAAQHNVVNVIGIELRIQKELVESSLNDVLVVVGLFIVGVLGIGMSISIRIGFWRSLHHEG